MVILAPTPDLRVAPPRPSAEHLRQLADLAEWHRVWTARNLPGAEFKPRPGDYNLHYLDLDASTEVEAQFRRRADEIMGVDNASQAARALSEAFDMLANGWTPEASRATAHPGQRYRHGWIPVAGLSLLGESHSTDRLEEIYGAAIDNEEFSPGAYVELGEHGDVHIDLAAEEPLHYHVFADMGQDDADQFGDDIDWALEATPGNRAPDPVNGLVDWRERDGVIVGYTPSGDVRIGWPAGDSDVDVLDLPPDEARVLTRKLWEFARTAIDGGGEE